MRADVLRKRNFTREELAAIGFKETILTLIVSGRRVVLFRSTHKYQYVLRVVSASTHAFDLVRAAALLEADLEACTIVVVGHTFPIAEAIAERYVPAGTVVMPLLVAETDPQYLTVVAKHVQETDEFVLEQVGFKIPRPLPVMQQRIWDRLGNVGYDLLAAQSVFASARSAPHIAAQTLLAFRKALSSKKGRDGLVALQLGWNVVVQAYVALENLAALYESLRATADGDYNAFAQTYLRFGRTDGLAQHTVHNSFQSLRAPGSEKEVARTFSIPLHRGHIKEYGLATCRVDPDKLVALGKATVNALMERFHRLAALVIFNAAPAGQLSYDPRKSLAKRAYDALHHGFSIVLPVLAPYPQVVSVYGGFMDEDAFAADVRARDFGGIMLDLDSVTSATSRIIAPSTPDQVKPFANAVALATILLHELTKYAQDKLGSVDGRMPYFMNASVHLTPEEYRELHRVLDELRGA